MKSFHEQFKNKSRLQLSESLVLACERNDIDKVKYLLTSPELKNKANINYNNDSVFDAACIQGNFELVKYLTSSPELKIHSSIYSNDCIGFRHACEFGNLDIIDFLLFSPELKNHINLNKIGDLAFQRSLIFNKLDVVHYFIFKANIKKTNEIVELIKDFPNQQVEDWFKMREINEDLKEELTSNKNITKKLKI